MTSAKVLLVGDEPAFLRLAGAWLEAQGYAVARATIFWRLLRAA